MADEKEPQRDPSEPHDNESSTEADRVESEQDNTTEEGLGQPAQVDDAAQNADTSTAGQGQEVDAETRMLQQIAALGGGDVSGGSEYDQAAEVDDEAAAEGTEPAVEESDPAAEETEQTKTIAPVAAGVAGGGAGSTGSGGGDTTVEEPGKKRRWPWIVAILIVVLGVGYVGVAYATQDTLPSNLQVEGVDVSGMSIDEAAPVIDEELADRAERELVVAAPDAEASIVPAEAGYSYDVDATLDELTDLTFNPVDIWDRLFGEADVAAKTAVDDDAAQDAIAGLSEQLTSDPTEGSIAYEGDTLDYSAPINGYTIDSEQLGERLDEYWLGTASEIDAPGEAVAPTVSEEDWDQFVEETAQPLVDDAYTVTADDETAELTPAQLGEAAEVRVEETEAGDAPVLSLDGEALTESLSENSEAFESTNQDATVELSGSAGSASPEVVPGSSGRGVDGEQVVDELMADLQSEQTRSISVELHEVEPSVTTEDAEDWDVNHVAAEYSTPYPASDEPRTANLRVGASRVNGTVVMPDEEFNLDALLAPVTEGNGYHSSGVVESGVTTNAIGGGLSQIATMSYNAGFMGGMDIVEHKPHSRWFDRYPQGHESTYWEGQINVRWKNDTDAPVIVEMWLADSEVHTRLWGSDYYDISTSTSDPYNFTASPTIRSDDDECISESGGDQGFTVDVNRTKTPPSGSSIEETWSWAYSGWPTVICE